MVQKTPGVYIVENNAFPNSMFQVPTAVPAFIGYTHTAMINDISLYQQPTRLNSMAEYLSFFGGPPEPQFKIIPLAARDGPSPLSAQGVALPPELPIAKFTVASPTGSEEYELVQLNKAFALFSAMRLFFLNGGGECYVTSIGTYDGDRIEADAMIRAISRLRKQPEPTMLVVPETTRLPRQDAAKVHNAMLKHCGTDMKNRFAILDIHGGYLAQTNPRGDPIEVFRNDIGGDDLGYGAAYYPWLDSTLYQSRDFTYENIDFDSRETFIELLKRSVPNSTEIAAEIDRIGTPVLTGDFAIMVPSGATVVLGVDDISAKDETSNAAKLIYEIDGDALGMCGQLVLSGTKGPALTTFTQQELETGQVSFIHDPALGAAGQFDLAVKDETGTVTEPRKIVIIAGTAVMNLKDVALGKTIVIDVAKDHSGSDPSSVTLLDADPVEIAKEGNATGEMAETKTVPKVGVWSVGPGGRVTFAPVADFTGSQATVRYTLSVDGVVQGPFEIKVLLEADQTDRAFVEVSAKTTIDKTMRATVPLYADVMNAITSYMNVLPPAAAMAGIYTELDSSRGVWKAPANVAVRAVSGPMVTIGHQEQEDLNVSPTTGKSINAIRSFANEGTLVWGARTLDGNSLDWRYVNVRRTMIMLEQSIQLGAKAFVFEPNTANTWGTIRSGIENFLTEVWKQGGLAGAVPADAFSVHIGLGESMTSQDILDGVMRFTVLVAISRPAEFIEITFQQQMQKS